jgi:transcriptional regulator with XRE-family HTH domain
MDASEIVSRLEAGPSAGADEVGFRVEPTTLCDALPDHGLSRKIGQDPAGASGDPQRELARSTGILQSTISAIEKNSVNLGVERAKVLVRALRCHPTVLMLPGGNIHKPSAA